jgi:uncharacterized membrane protein
MKNGVVILFLFLVVAEACLASTIHGTVYDSGLDPVRNVVVEVNSIPSQRFIAKDGSYSFSLSRGDYVVTTRYNGMVAHENITIVDDSGDYVIDLFLFPTFEDEEGLLNDSNFDVGNITLPKSQPSVLPFVILVIIILALGAGFIIFYVKLKKRAEKEFASNPKEDIGDLDTFVKFIKEEGGRVTQKDIRKKFPLSEAKISLMISELEHKGLIEKIKKGRGNIIVLKK